MLFAQSEFIATRITFNALNDCTQREACRLFAIESTSTTDCTFDNAER